MEDVSEQLASSRSRRRKRKEVDVSLALDETSHSQQSMQSIHILIKLKLKSAFKPNETHYKDICVAVSYETGLLATCILLV